MSFPRGVFALPLLCAFWISGCSSVPSRNPVEEAVDSGLPGSVHVWKAVAAYTVRELSPLLAHRGDNIRLEAADPDMPFADAYRESLQRAFVAAGYAVEDEAQLVLRFRAALWYDLGSVRNALGVDDPRKSNDLLGRPQFRVRTVEVDWPHRDEFPHETILFLVHDILDRGNILSGYIAQCRIPQDEVALYR